MFAVTKSTSINLRISPEFRADLEKLAAFHGLTLSSFAHSLLVKAVRHEKSELPDLFAERPLAPVVAHIGPADAAAGADIDEVRRMISDDEVAEIESRLRPRRTRNVAVLKEKAR